MKWQPRVPNIQGAMEHGLPNSKIDGQSIRIFLNSQRNPRLGNQEAKGDYPIKVVSLAQFPEPNHFSDLPPFD